MDARVREQVATRIASYDGEVASLRSLVADLDAIWNTEQWNEDQRSRFRAGWERLEEVYATATERRPREMTPIDIERVHGVLIGLIELLPPATPTTDETL